MERSRVIDYADFCPGIYLHYKKHLYEADHLTHNSSENNRIEIHYVGLQLENAKDGPRHATREHSEFLLDIVHEDGSKCEHDGNDQAYCETGKKVAKRFRYLGPIFKSWMLDADPWDRVKA